jgi:hypothetical protein
MWHDTADPADAEPVITLVEASTCFRSNGSTCPASRDTAGIKETPSKRMVAVLAAESWFTNMMFVMTAVTPVAV